jgi:hypothetical protein
MDSQIDLTLIRDGTPIANQTFDHVSANPDWTDVPSAVLESWLEDAWNFVKDAWGLDWKKALADVKKMYDDVSAGSNYSSGASANLMLWQGGLLSAKNQSLATGLPGELQFSYHAWSGDDLTAHPFCRIDPPTKTTSDPAQQATHDFRQTLHVSLTSPLAGSFVLSAAASDSGTVFNVSAASSLTVTVAPGTGQCSHSGFFTQGNFGAAGNFELVTPVAGGGLRHYWRDNDVSPPAWNAGPEFAKELGAVDAVALVQSGFSAQAAAGQAPIGNLELVVRAGQRLVAYWRDDGPGLNWQLAGDITNANPGDPTAIEAAAIAGTSARQPHANQSWTPGTGWVSK